MRENEGSLMRRVAEELQRPVRLDASFDRRVMAMVRSLPRHRRWERLLRPRTLRVTPLGWGLLAAGMLVAALVGGAAGAASAGRAARTGTASRALGALAAGRLPTRAATSAAAAQPVQFVLVAPAARKVAVVGDFNDWDASHADYQAQPHGGGVWSITARVPAGHYRYAFVVDDSLFVADPTAPRTSDDYGMPSSAIVVDAEETQR